VRPSRSEAGPAGAPIPVTVLSRVYRALEGVPAAGRLEFATWLVEHPEVVDHWLWASVRAMGRYTNTSQPFHEHRPLRSPEYGRSVIGNTAGFVAWLSACPNADGFWRIGQNRTSDLALVDYEVMPTRTKPATTFEDGRRSTSGIKADLLLIKRDGTPVVSELKVTASSNDKDPFFALIQALALVSELVTPQQRARLQIHYPAACFRESGPVEVAVILFRPSELPRATHHQRLYEAAVALASALTKCATYCAIVGQTTFLEARINDASLLVLTCSEVRPPGHNP
jgi:hypothetical protein